MKREALTSAKFKLAAADLGIPVCYFRGVVETLWLVVGSSLPAGDIGRWSNEEIGAAIDYPEDADKLVAVLVKRRFLDEIKGPARLFIHDWHEHADPLTHRRLARAGQDFANESPPNLQLCLKSERDAYAERSAYARRTTAVHTPSAPRDYAVSEKGKGKEKGKEKRGVQGAGAPAADAAPPDGLASGQENPLPPKASPASKPAAKPHADPATLRWPPPLDAPPCRAAFDRWLGHRREARKPVTPTAAQAQLDRWARAGPDPAARFVAAVDRSIANGWQGIFEGNDNGPSNGTANGRRGGAAAAGRVECRDDEPPPREFDAAAYRSRRAAAGGAAGAAGGAGLAFGADDGGGEDSG